MYLKRGYHNEGSAHQYTRGKTTQQTIADQCGISQNFYNMIEQGKRTPSVDVAKIPPLF
ncbi:MAG: helix-turn-helix transcriptional regulator [Firmicutes bacterium]|nr:helix-turn-helix transcriptional regulator [Bacillota bacterium]